MTRARQHPAGLSAQAAVVLVWLLAATGVNMPPEVAAALVGVVTGLVSLRTPRG